MSDSTVLPQKVIHTIRSFIDDMRKNEKLVDRFPNTVLREDVLEILELYCTVIFFPIEDRNNGFHITGIPNRNGVEQHFVFINTSQSIEKQVFTAAHELGHVLEVDGFVEKEAKFQLNSDLRECVINRFAAELLMPITHFETIAFDEFEKYKNGNGKITILSLLKLVASLMNYFFVPEKAIIRRLGEIGALDSETVSMLTENNSKVGGIPIREIVSKTIEQIIQSNGYTELQKGSQKKAIKGLQDLLEKAETMQSVTQCKIDSLRKTFEILEPQNRQELDEKILFSNKGNKKYGDRQKDCTC